MKKMRAATLGAFIWLSGCKTVFVEDSYNEPMTTDVFQQACESTAMDYAWHWDHFNSSDFANLFTSDARLQIPDNSLDGRAAIEKHQQSRQKNFVMRHVVSNSRFQRTSEKTAEGQMYVTVYGKRVDENGNVSVEGMLAMAEYHDRYRWVDGRCLFEERTTHRIFSGPETP